MTSAASEPTTDERTGATGTPPVTAVLIPGFWLGAWAWDAVLPGLRSAGIVPHPVTLPGLDDDGPGHVTLADQVEAVAALVSGLDGPVVLVGHSGGGLVVQGVVDRHPERVSRAIYVDCGPLLPGMALRPGSTTDVPLPSWEQLEAERCSLDGLDDAGKAEFRRRAVPVPLGVATGVLDLVDDRRLAVPASVIGTSLPSTVLLELIEAGQMPTELPSLDDVRYRDLATGHWPMFSRPDDLAGALASEILGP